MCARMHASNFKAYGTSVCVCVSLTCTTILGDWYFYYSHFIDEEPATPFIHSFHPFIH